MRNLLLIVLMLFPFTSCFSQDYNINFLAAGAAATIDNVIVQNITQGTSLTLQGNDVLHLLVSNGINDLNSAEETLEFSPNPMQGQTELSFYASKSGNVQINITDISGKNLIQANDMLSQGVHKYQISGLDKGIYLVSIIAEKYQYSKKLISKSLSGSKVNIKYLANEKIISTNNTLKNTKSTVNMAYHTGDRLILKGNSGVYSTSVSLIPTADNTITFTFISCSNFTKTHTAGSVAPVTKTVTYGTTATNITGSTQCWITQNLGASNQATFSIDSSESARGWFWQFNRTQGYKHDGLVRTPNTTWITSIVETSNWTPANDPCALLLGSGWRIPTNVEWTNADEENEWSNYNDTYASILKLHTAGYLNYSDATLHGKNTYLHFWSSTELASGSGLHLLGTFEYSYTFGLNKAFGFSVRCLK